MQNHPGRMRRILESIGRAGVEIDVDGILGDGESQPEPEDLVLEEMGVDDYSMEEFHEQIQDEFGLFIPYLETNFWRTVADVMDYVLDRNPDEDV